MSNLFSPSPHTTIHKKFLVSLYARPMTKEIFNKKCETLDFLDDSYKWDTVLDFYFDEEFWAYFPELSSNGVHKLIFVLNLQTTAYYDNYNGDYDVYDTFNVESILYSSKAECISELREFVKELNNV